MLHNSLLNLQFAQHVAGTFMPIIRNLKLYRRSQHVTHNFGYASGLRNVARAKYLNPDA